jgi:hypothetical protein
MRTLWATPSSRLHAGLQIFLVLMLLAGLLGTFSTQNAAEAASIPVFSITAVEQDSLVTIKTSNFPANRTFVVRIGAYGTLAIGGVEVGTTFSGTGGVFTATYAIPDSLKGQARLAIRLDSTTGGFYSYNWFWNNATASPIYGTGGAVTSYSGVPTFQIMDVVKDSTVTIKTNNFPANKTFTVRMGAYGTLAIGGTVVASTDSGDGGTFTITYSIPTELYGASRLAIRLDSTSGGFYSYNWFWNNPTSTSIYGTGGPIYTGVPTFSVSAVVKDDTVTILTNNFPADRTFTVRMGNYGTLGIGGIVVASTASGTGGSFSASYAIPDALKGQPRIAIRLDSTTGGFYSYNWFWNN